MTILVDGNNVAMSWESLEPLDRGNREAVQAACLRLVEMLAGYRKATVGAHRIIVVFDGPFRRDAAEAGRDGSVEVVFGEGESADRVILEEVDLCVERGDKEIRVATSDRALTSQAEYLGAKVWKALEFEREVHQRSCTSSDRSRTP